jgi:uncharacterized protein YecT (DUF1311 family)
MGSLRRYLCGFGLLMAAMVTNAAAQQSVPAPPPDQQAPAPVPVVFQDRIPANQLALLKRFEGMQSGKAMKDTQFHEVLRGVIPDCDVHYGWDMPLLEALDAVMEGSKIPVQIRDGRYLIVSGRNGPYLDGRGLIWIDLQEGIGLGGLYFHPTNGEMIAVFSQQVRMEEKSVAMEQLPVAFVNDLGRWSDAFRIPPVTTRYFLTGSNVRVLLEHDEDYCSAAVAAGPGTPGPQSNHCEQMNADAADLDLNAAYYLQQVNYRTNATGWMIVSREQEDWIQDRDTACKVEPDPLGCHIRMTREHMHVVLKQDTSPKIAYY